MCKAIRASLLILTLACSAQAGYMPNGTPEPPPPAQPVVAQGNSIQNDSTTQPPSPVEGTSADGWTGSDAAASLTQVALELFALFPSLL